MKNAEISIIIPTYNRRASLERVLTALQAQTLPRERFEVVVVSDGSSDGTNEYLQALEASQALPVKAIFQANQGVAVARNNGVRAATAELVLFLDDDVIPAPQLVAEHLNYQPRSVIMLGPMLTPPDGELEPWVLWEQRMLEKQYQDMLAGRWEPTARQFYTGNTSLYKKYLEQAGGFDPTFRRAEDVELAYRLKDMGCRFEFNPRAEGFHYARRSFAAWNNVATAYGHNDIIMARTKGQDWLIPTIFEEYRHRNALIRGLTELCLGRPRLANACIRLLGAAARLGASAGKEAVSRAAYSGIFNLRYYQGAADELGGRAVFFQALASTPPPTTGPAAQPAQERRKS
jgi:GT2 family glycosyltransferase